MTGPARSPLCSLFTAGGDDEGQEVVCQLTSRAVQCGVGSSADRGRPCRADLPTGLNFRLYGKEEWDDLAGGGVK